MAGSGIRRGRSSAWRLVDHAAGGGVRAGVGQVGAPAVELAVEVVEVAVVAETGVPDPDVLDDVGVLIGVESKRHSGR